MFRWLYALSYLSSIIIGAYLGFHLGQYTSTTVLDNLDSRLPVNLFNYIFQFLGRFWKNPQESFIILFSYGSAGLLMQQLISNHGTFYYFLDLRQRQRQNKSSGFNLIINNLGFDIAWAVFYILAQAILPYVCFWAVGGWLFFQLFVYIWYFSIVPAALAARFASIHSTNLINIIFTPGDLRRSMMDR